MTESLVPWAVVVLLLGWLVGAYNRLVRLRGQVKAGFQTLGDALAGYVALVDDCAKSAAGFSLAELPLQPMGDQVALWSSLQAANAQFDESLRIARRQPLDAASMAALQTALAVLQVSWKKIGDACVHQPHLLPPQCTVQWSDTDRLVAQAVAAFNRDVLAHNHAIAQFPALLLAHLFSFRAAGCL